jgi:hypothetical protein
MDKASVTISLTATIDPPWTAMPSVRLGAVSRGVGTPDLFVLVAQSDEPVLRLDLYRSPELELYVRDEAIGWREWIAVGFGYRAFLIHATDRRVCEIALPLYFEGFRAIDNCLLILAAEGIVCLNQAGEVVWMNSDLAIDGLEVDTIDGEIISGRGDWDPPGGWRSFRIRLDTGELIDQAV